MINKYIKKRLTEEIQNLYNVIDRNPNELNSAKLPSTREFGMHFELTDGRKIHAMCIYFNPDSVYGTITEDGLRVHTFDLNGQAGTYYNTFAKNIDKLFQTPILDEKETRKIFDTYLQRLKLK